MVGLGFWSWSNYIKTGRSKIFACEVFGKMISTMIWLPARHPHTPLHCPSKLHAHCKDGSHTSQLYSSPTLIHHISPFNINNQTSFSFRSPISAAVAPTPPHDQPPEPDHRRSEASTAHDALHHFHTEQWTRHRSPTQSHLHSKSVTTIRSPNQSQSSPTTHRHHHRHHCPMPQPSSRPTLDFGHTPEGPLRVNKGTIPPPLTRCSTRPTMNTSSSNLLCIHY